MKKITTVALLGCGAFLVHNANDLHKIDKKVNYIIDKYNLTGHERNLYKCGYLDGLQAAIVVASDNAAHSYTLNLDDIFNE